MRHLAPDIGHAGMEQPQNNFALVAYFIMKILMLVIGPKTLLDVKNIVSYIHIIHYINCRLYFANISMHKKSIMVFFFVALCKDDANGNVPLGKSCNRYWACQGGYPRLQRCPAMLVFDKQRKRCVAPPTADCDVPPPPPPSEDDEENEEEDEERPFRY